MNKYTLLIILILTFQGYPISPVLADTKRPVFENKHFRLRLITRSPNQIAAFYEARGFPKFAIDELRKVCFITIGLKNKGKDIIWLDLRNWHFLSHNHAVRRYLREDWKIKWNQLGLEKRFQSTFRWTLMPEQLDFRAYEAEGGNIILPRINTPISIEATLHVGNNKEKAYKVPFKNIFCAEDTNQ